VNYSKAMIEIPKEISRAHRPARRRARQSKRREPDRLQQDQIKQMPLSADSIKMDAQYFSNAENEQGASNTVFHHQGYVSASTSF